jgi:hypothetical protein
MLVDQLIKYFVYETKGHITKTQLVKFIYLADLYAVKWTGKQLTDLDWCYYHYGPWNEEIDRALARMEGVDIFQKQMNEATLIEPVSLEKIGKDLDFPMGLRLILNNIKREWAGSKKIQPLLDYVYSTAPMTEVKKDNPDPEAKVRLDLKKEREKLLCELGV